MLLPGELRAREESVRVEGVAHAKGRGEREKAGWVGEASSYGVSTEANGRGGGRPRVWLKIVVPGGAER